MAARMAALLVQQAPSRTAPARSAALLAMPAPSLPFLELQPALAAQLALHQQQELQRALPMRAIMIWARV